MKTTDTYDESIKGILERYAYNMSLYYGKPELKQEYKKMIEIRSFTASTTQDGDIELVIKLAQ